MIYSNTKYPKYYWLNDDSRTFLSRGYINETPEQRIKDIAITAEKYLGIIGFAKKFEDYMSRGFYSLSTPVWINFGKQKGLSISCYGSNVDDNLDSILNAGREIGMMSKYGGGTSVYLGNVRPRGSVIATGGLADGPVHYARIYDTTVDVCKQSEARRGACAAWLPIEHLDASEFLDIGTEGNPIQNLQYGITVTDKWLNEMKEGDPEKRKLWAKVIQRRNEFGFPYIMFKDNSNNHTSPYKELGLEITASNLCLVGSDRVVSNRGYLTAKELYEQGGELILFDGNKSVKSSEMKLREKNADVFKITLENGLTHTVTSYHKIPVLKNNSEIHEQCKNLRVGDKIPIQVNKGLFGVKSMKDEAFLLGLYQSDGTQNKDLIMLDIWENDFDIINETQEKFNNIHYKYKCDKYEIVNKLGKTGFYRNRKPATFHKCVNAQSNVKKVRLTSKTLKKALNFEKGYIPDWIWESDEQTQWEYVRGLLIADGSVHLSKSKGKPIQISYADINYDFLQELQLLFNNLGLQSSIKLLHPEGKTLLPNGKGDYKYYNRQACYRLIISNKNSALELEKYTGFLSRKNINLENKKYRDNSKKYFKIKSIEYAGKEDVYCPTVDTKKHEFICQGMKTVNCSEIQLPTDSFNSFVCCLGSINLLHWDEIKKTDAIEIYVYFLNAVMDEFIEKSRTLPGMKRAYNFAVNHRAIGLGVLGYHSLLQSKLIEFESLEAKVLNNQIFKTLNLRSQAASVWLHTQGYRCLRDGYANTTLLAIAPTKSSSFILGQTSMGIEPIKSNYFIKDLAKSKTVYKNSFLEEELEKYNLNTPEVWESILKKDGSVQHLDFPTKAVFKSFIEISPKEIILQASLRQKYIDQSQSLNLMIHPSVPAKDINQLYLYAWEQGVKTLYYQFSQSSAQSFSRNILECASCEG